MRKRWIQVKGELVPIEEYSPEPRVHVLGDIQPYRSMVDGQMVEGRRQHREHLKAHNVIEVGNDVSLTPKPVTTPGGLKDAIGRAVYRHLG